MSRTTSLSPCATGKRVAFAFAKVLFSYAKWIYIMLKAAKKVRATWEQKNKKTLKLRGFRAFWHIKYSDRLSGGGEGSRTPVRKNV